MDEKLELHLIDDAPRKLFIADINLVTKKLNFELITYVNGDAALEFWQAKEKWSPPNSSRFFLFDALMPYSQKLEEKFGPKQELQLTGCILANKLITKYHIPEKQIAVVSLYEAAKKEAGSLNINFFSKTMLNLAIIEKWLTSNLEVNTHAHY